MLLLTRKFCFAVNLNCKVKVQISKTWEEWLGQKIESQFTLHHPLSEIPSPGWSSLMFLKQGINRKRRTYLFSTCCVLILDLTLTEHSVIKWIKPNVFCITAKPPLSYIRNQKSIHIPFLESRMLHQQYLPLVTQIGKVYWCTYRTESTHTKKPIMS